MPDERPKSITFLAGEATIDFSCSPIVTFAPVRRKWWQFWKPYETMMITGIRVR